VLFQNIQKWEKLQNVCDVEQCASKTFIATRKQTGYKRSSDKKRLNYVGT
jgi:hypothetical protein